MPRRGKRSPMDISMEPVLQDYNISTSLTGKNSGIFPPSDSSLFEHIADFDCDLPDITFNNTENVNISSGPYPPDSTIEDLQKRQMSVFKRPFTTRARKMPRPSLFESDIKDSETDTPEAKIRPFQRKTKPLVDANCFDLDSSNESFNSSIAAAANFISRRKSRRTKCVENHSFEKDLNSSESDSSFKKPVLPKPKIKPKKVSAAVFDEVFHDTLNGSRSDASYSQQLPFENVKGRHTNVAPDLFDSVLNSSDSLQQSLGIIQENDESSTALKNDHHEDVKEKSELSVKNQDNIEENDTHDSDNTLQVCQEINSTCSNKSNCTENTHHNSSNIEEDDCPSLASNNDNEGKVIETEEVLHNLEVISVEDMCEMDHSSIINSDRKVKKTLTPIKDEKILSCLENFTHESIDTNILDNNLLVNVDEIEINNVPCELSLTDKRQIYNKLNHTAQDQEIGLSENLPEVKVSSESSDMDPLSLESKTKIKTPEDVDKDNSKYHESSGRLKKHNLEMNQLSEKIKTISEIDLNVECQGRISRTSYNRKSSLKRVSFDLRNTIVVENQSPSQLNYVDCSLDSLVMESSSGNVNSESVFIDLHASKSRSSSGSLNIDLINSNSSKIQKNIGNSKTEDITFKEVDDDAEEDYQVEDFTEDAESTLTTEDDEVGSEEEEEEVEDDEEEKEVEDEEEVEENEEEETHEDSEKSEETAIDEESEEIEEVAMDEGSVGIEITKVKVMEGVDKSNSNFEENTETLLQHNSVSNKEYIPIQNEDLLTDRSISVQKPHSALVDKLKKTTVHNTFKTPHPVPLTKSKLQKILDKIPISELKKKKRKSVIPADLTREQMQQNEIDEALKKRKIQGPLLTKKPSNKLKMPKKWVAPGIYDLIIEKLQPQYGIRTRIQAEKVVLSLAEHVSRVLKTDGDYFEIVEEIKQELASLRIIHTHWDFYRLAKRYFTYDFVDKVYKGNLKNPYEPENIFENIQ
uniref:Uncharacterized protein n=1 Tax=Graphocephala atropunctata TaxID=36148 RepID=A0A1B6KVC7_9HEMI